MAQTEKERTFTLLEGAQTKIREAALQAAGEDYAAALESLQTALGFGALAMEGLERQSRDNGAFTSDDGRGE